MRVHNVQLVESSVVTIVEFEPGRFSPEVKEEALGPSFPPLEHAEDFAIHWVTALSHRFNVVERNET